MEVSDILLHCQTRDELYAQRIQNSQFYEDVEEIVLYLQLLCNNVCIHPSML